MCLPKLVCIFHVNNSLMDSSSSHVFVTYSLCESAPTRFIHPLFKRPDSYATSYGNYYRYAFLADHTSPLNTSLSCNFLRLFRASRSQSNGTLLDAVSDSTIFTTSQRVKGEENAVDSNSWRVFLLERALLDFQLSFLIRCDPI